MSPTEPQQEQPDGLWIDGVAYTISDLTYREQRTLRDLVRSLAPDNLDPADAPDADYVPAIITVIKQRTDPAFTIDQALDFKPSDLEPPARPTKPAATKMS